mgnify:CR=1 FL=1
MIDASPDPVSSKNKKITQKPTTYNKKQKHSIKNEPTDRFSMTTFKRSRISLVTRKIHIQNQRLKMLELEKTTITYEENSKIKEICCQKLESYL